MLVEIAGTFIAAFSKVRELKNDMHTQAKSRDYILTAFGNRDGIVSIFIEANYAASLHAHLVRKKVNCKPPSHAITVVFRERVGKRAEMVANLITAEGTLENFNEWIGNWETPIF